MKEINGLLEIPVSILQDEKLNGNAYGEPIEMVSVEETHYGFKIEAQIPDSMMGNCNVDFEHGILTISGHGILGLELNLIRMANHTNENVHSYRNILSGRWFGSDKIQVTYNARLFTINIPKKELLQKFSSQFFII